MLTVINHYDIISIIKKGDKTMKSNYQMIMEIKDWKPFQHCIISEKEANHIREVFCIKDRTNVELQNLRDFVVIYYGMESKKHHEKSFDTMDKMSAITYVIDNEKFNRGLEV